MVSTQIFRNRNFLYYWTGSLFAGLGDAVFALALTWLVVESTGSAAMVGALFLTMGVPRVVLTLFAGVLVDRLQPIRGMILCEWVRVLTSGGLFVLGLLGPLPLWSLFAAAFVFGVLEAFFWPAASAVRQRLVEPEFYTQASGLLMIAMKTTVIIGPLLGGTLVALSSYRAVLAIVAAAFLAGLVLLSFVRLTFDRVELQAAKHSSYWKDLREGIVYIMKTPLILTTSLVAFLVNACSSIAPVAVPFLAASFGGGAQEFGWLNTSIGIGGTIGAVLFAVILIKRPTPRMTLIACFAEGLVFLTLGLAGQFWLALVLIALIGITDAAINVIAPSVNQSIIPPELVGRVISVMILLMSGSVPLAQALGGYLVQTIGVQQVFLLNGSLEMLIAGFAFFLPVIARYQTAKAST
ncbi:putative MFS family arabinose efflux permease [Tumebacillus sp. BK434]|uniref:MFS transporter n=1 Tax=Tumebacillus sp. BK434 TaxID=2512169 RepID=UPI0010CF7E0E|nr:MFS transporter [Tumebacillus sp. BK434]TCP59303.1 putative MFS family arabinose efflux permease [Tumebacillus sp. BK434]